MDLTRLGGNSWNDTSLYELGESSRLIKPPGSLSLSLSPSKNKGNANRTPVKLSLPNVHSLNPNEKPASRTEIAALEHDLRERLLIIQQLSRLETPNLNMKELYEPLKENISLFRSRLLKKLNLSEDAVAREVWLMRLVQAECMQNVCEDVATKLSGMISVTSAELGIVMRKFKGAYANTFLELRASWDEIQSRYEADKDELALLRGRLSSYGDDLKERENTVRKRMESKMAEMERQFQHEQEKDNIKLKEAELQILQMSESLRTLNGIFKTMQQDESATKATDLVLKCNLLESELDAVTCRVSELDEVKDSLSKSEVRIKQLEQELRQKNADMSTFRGELARRDATIATLMEKEALINAEMTLLKQITERKSNESGVKESDLEGPPTSVLCIKCKKGLDDVSNIRAVLLAARDDAAHRLECESFRILLPNLRGKRPDRSSSWVRACMRSILVSKMREDVVIHNITGDHIRFPHYVYSWFERESPGFGTAANMANLVAADEDRWGLYYGVRALSKDSDSESMLFWGLIDEAHKQDGMQFLMHCVSVAFTMGGSPFWTQFGQIMQNCGNIKRLTSDSVEHTPPYIWLSLRTAIDATKAIMNKSPVAQLNSTLETIDTMKESPMDKIKEDMIEEGLELPPPMGTELRALPSLDNNSSGGTRRKSVKARGTRTSRDNTKDGTSSKDTGNKEPTHINFFMWLRVMMRQFQEDQNIRHAAIRLMFEAASVGALTPQVHTTHDSNSSRSVEFPQFQAICGSLFPNMNTTEYAALFNKCYEEGKKKVTAEVFTRIADLHQCFSKTLYLEAFPLMTPEDYLPSVQQYILRQQSAIPAADNIAALTTSTSASTIPTRRGSIKMIPGTGTIAVSSTNVTKSIQIYQEKIASKIHSLIHLKLAVITPELMQLMLFLPEKWRLLLKVARDRVQISLTDSLSRITRRQKTIANEGPRAQPDTLAHCVDGLQPFLEYKRLLALMMLTKSYTENPFLPNDIFGNDSKNKGKPNLCRAEALLNYMEEAILVCGGESSTLHKSFEQARLTIVVRRLQATYRAHKKKKFKHDHN